jgi:hypothetical protein
VLFLGEKKLLLGICEAPNPKPVSNDLFIESYDVFQNRKSNFYNKNALG